MRLLNFRRQFTPSDPKIAANLRDPAGALSREPLEVVDRPIPGLIALAVLAGLTYLAPDRWIKVVVLRYVLLGLLLIAPFYVILWKRRVTLDVRGFEYAYGRRSVFIPWPLFDESASCTLQADTLKLPVRPSAVVAIEHRRDGVAV